MNLRTMRTLEARKIINLFATIVKEDVHLIQALSLSIAIKMKETGRRESMLPVKRTMSGCPFPIRDLSTILKTVSILLL